MLGLRTTASDDGAILLSANEKHHELQLIRGDRPGLDHLGLEVDDEAELERARDSVVAAGATIPNETPQEEGLAHAFRARGPADLVVEVYVGMQREPMSVLLGVRGPLRKLGHINAFTPAHEELVELFTRGLGFRVSDRLAGP